MMLIWERSRIITCSNGVIAETAEARRVHARNLVAGLQPDEHRALDLFVEGFSLAAVAAQQGLSLEAADRLKAGLMSKLGASATADLVRIGSYARADADR